MPTLGSHARPSPSPSTLPPLLTLKVLPCQFDYLLRGLLIKHLTSYWHQGTFHQPVPPAFLSCMGQHVHAPRAGGLCWLLPNQPRGKTPVQVQDREKGTMTRAKAVQTARTSLHPLESVTEDPAAGAQGPRLSGLGPQQAAGPLWAPGCTPVE